MAAEWQWGPFACVPDCTFWQMDVGYFGERALSLLSRWSCGFHEHYADLKVIIENQRVVAYFVALDFF
jgi:hypothetical protein